MAIQQKELFNAGITTAYLQSQHCMLWESDAVSVGERLGRAHKSSSQRLVMRL